MGAAAFGGLSFAIQSGLGIFNEVRKMVANQDVANAQHEVGVATGLVEAQRSLRI